VTPHPKPRKIIRFGGATGFDAAKALQPMDSSAGKAINAEALRRKRRRVSGGFMKVAGQISITGRTGGHKVFRALSHALTHRRRF